MSSFLFCLSFCSFLEASLWSWTCSFHVWICKLIFSWVSLCIVVANYGGSNYIYIVAKTDVRCWLFCSSGNSFHDTDELKQAVIRSAKIAHKI
jgi:hypothetical protein